MQFSDLLDRGITFFPLGEPLVPQDIARWEQNINAPFPEQYRDYLLHTNGGKMKIKPEHKEIVDCYVFDVKWPEGLTGKSPYAYLGNFFMISGIETDRSDVLTFNYNYYSWKDVLPPDTFPIANTPFGNYLLIGLKGENRGKIYYWMLEATNAMLEPEIAARAYMGWVANSFCEFILNLKYYKENSL